MPRLYASQQSKFYMEQVPIAVTTAIRMIVTGSYADSARFVEERWSAREAKDALPHVRRADIETALTALRGRFRRDGVRVDKVPNKRGTAWHTEIRCGLVVITQSKTEGPEVPVREAEFRKSFAADCHLNLFPTEEQEPEDDADALWACVVHGPSENPAVPAYIKVAFPLPDGSFQDSITITTLGDANAGSKTEDIREAVAKLRRDARRDEQAL